MKRICIHIFIVGSLFVLCSACRKERDLSYQGPTVVEFSNPATGTTVKTMGPTIGGSSLKGDNPAIPIRGDRDSVLIQLVGPQRNDPVDIYYEVIPATAVEGVDFQIIGEPGSVTIESNSSATAIYLRLLNRDTNPASIKNVAFRITGTNQSDVSPSANYSSFTANIFPMRVFLDRTLTKEKPYFSLLDGESYDRPNENEQMDLYLAAGEITSLVSPAGRNTFFSQRLYTPGSDIPAYLQNSYVTLQLHNATSTTVNAIPSAGTASNAVTQSSAALAVNGVYAFMTTEGKKGYIRIKEVGTDNNCVFDIMFQP
ncbi:hypothetical protein [Olivibacter sp. XZL3]|uniref:hypothetical protein n=1 Tax=Olivibacter sp. XZL3 TaxID=1735116 RepID=UPI0010649429|nr:hypothetical protein [Olivibacter sp. XZL3]